MKNINLIELQKIIKEEPSMLGFDYDNQSKTIRLFTSDPYLYKSMKDDFLHTNVELLCGKRWHVR